MFVWMAELEVTSTAKLAPSAYSSTLSMCDSLDRGLPAPDSRQVKDRVLSFRGKSDRLAVLRQTYQSPVLYLA
jgi:hypothetical protein